MDGQRKAAGQKVILKGDGQEVPATMRDGVIFVPKEFVVRPRRKTTRHGRVRDTKSRPGYGTIVVTGLKDTPDYGPQAITQRLINALGNNTVASLLGVSKDRPSRWASGRDAPNEDNRLQLADLDSLVGHLLSAFTPAQAKLWLDGPNAQLGARPIDVYRLEGAAAVIEAIRAHEQGAFA